jgi:hypothetical protein
MLLREADYVHVLQRSSYYNLDVRSCLRLRFKKSYYIL